MYGEEYPKANIEVRLSIPSVNYMAAAQEIMPQYGEVVKDAMYEIKNDLLFNKKFQEEVKIAVKGRLKDAVEEAIKSAAKEVVWKTFVDVEANKNIKQVIEDSIINALQTK